MLNLVFALFWLVVAVVALVGAYVYPETPGLRLGGDGLPIGWLALCFVAYNLVRWYALRMAEARRRWLSEQSAGRRQQRERAARPERPPDPMFDFSDRPNGPDAALPGERGV